MTAPTAGAARLLKEHGLLFNTAMVRALLAGTKSQTRRAVRMGDVGFIGGCDDDHDDPDAWGFADGDGCLHVLDQSKPGWYGSGVPHMSYRIEAPHGPVGRVLWVRETHCPRYFDNGKPGYRADWTGESADVVPEPKWTPSLLMPRSLARITLEVTGVRLERVQAITEEDARAEGVSDGARATDSDGGQNGLSPSYRNQYRRLWDEINGAGSWASNPWVFAYSFRRIA